MLQEPARVLGLWSGLEHLRRAGERRPEKRPTRSHSGLPLRRTSCAPSRQIGVAAGGLGSGPTLVGRVFVPRKKPRCGRHDQDSRNTDNKMQPGTARELRQDEMSGKGQEYAKTEDLKGMLAAKD